MINIIKTRILMVIILSFVCVLCIQGGAQNIDGYNKLPVKIVLFPFMRVIISSNVEGKILKYHFKTGETFKKGDLLIDLQDSYYRQIFLKADATFKEADATSKYCDNNLKRKQNLFQKEALGFQELEQSKLEKETAYAKREYTNANLELAKIDLNSCKIKAPFKGKITRKLKEEHEYVKKGEPVVELIDDNKLLAIIHLPSNERNMLKEGMNMKFKIDETKTEVSGTVYEISGDIDPGSRTFQVRVLIDNTDQKLFSGMSGTYIEEKDGITGK